MILRALFACFALCGEPRRRNGAADALVPVPVPVGRGGDDRTFVVATPPPGAAPRGRCGRTAFAAGLLAAARASASLRRHSAGDGGAERGADAEDASPLSLREELPPLFSDPPAIVFADLAAANGGGGGGGGGDDDSVVRMDDLNRWAELRELIADGEVMKSEVREIFRTAASNSESAGMLDVDGFARLYGAIEDLFEEDPGYVVPAEEDAAAAMAADEEPGEEPEQESTDAPASRREEFLSLLSEVGRAGEERLPCGLDCSDREREQISSMVERLEGEASNAVRSKGGIVEARDLVGDWELLYTSSSTFVINRGLSGLGRSSSEQARFGGLRQKLRGSKYLADVEFVERIEAGEESFDVTVTGEWELKGGSNPITGEPATVMRVDPEKVMYGPTVNSAEDWASLGPIKMLDVIYLDGGLLIMRGSMKLESIFVFQKVNE